MKYLLAIFLILTLNANSFASSRLCMMEYDIISTQDQSMPCHDSVQETSNTVEPHLCDCDMSSQFIYTFVLNIFSSPLVTPTYFNKIQHKPLTISFKYRPPIHFSC